MSGYANIQLYIRDYMYTCITIHLAKICVYMVVKHKLLLAFTVLQEACKFYRIRGPSGKSLQVTADNSGCMETLAVHQTQLMVIGCR